MAQMQFSGFSDHQITRDHPIFSISAIFGSLGNSGNLF